MRRIRARAPIARYGAQTSPSASGQLAKMLGIGLATVLVAVLGVAGWLFQDLSASYTADAVELEGEAPPSFAELEGGTSILVAGTDNCEPEYAALFGDRCLNAEDGVRSDVLMLAHISDTPRRVTVISFPRDLLVDIPSCTDARGNETSESRRQMINSAFSIGGLSCSVKTVADLTGLSIPYAASINWGGVIDVTNAIGGVDVCVATEMRDADSGVNLGPGTHNLQGEQALAFLRARKSTPNGSDTARIGNQQLYMSSLVRKISSEQVLSNPTMLMSLAKTILSAVDPSTSLTNPVTLVQVGLALKDIPVSDYVFVQYPAEPAPEDPNRLVPIPASATALFDALALNEPLTLTPNVEEQNEATPEPEVPAPTPTEPGQGAAVLPSDIPGTTGDTVGCTSGRVY